MAKITYTGTGTGYNFESAQTIQLTHDTFPTNPITLNTITARLYFKPSRYGFNVSFTATAGGYSSTVTHFVAAGDIDGFYLDFPFDVSQSFPWRTLSSITVVCNSNAETKGYMYSRAVSQYVYVYYSLAYTKTTAPTSISMAQTNVAPGTQVDMTWSGAAAGESNAITGYAIYRSTTADGTYSLLDTTSTASQSGSDNYWVESPQTNNSSYYFKIKTLGTVSGYDSGLSSKYAKLTTKWSDPMAPIATAPSSVVPGQNITVSWHGDSAGTNNPILTYRVQRKIEDGSWETVASVQERSCTISTAASNSGQTWYFRVRAMGQLSNSPYSGWVSTYIRYAPSAPVIESGETGCSYNPRPIVLVTVSKYGTIVSNLKVSADGYSASRSKKLTSEARVRLRRKTAMNAGSETIIVNNTDGYTTASDEGTVTVGAATFTDPDLEKGSTLVKAAHINELRTMLDNIAAYYGLTAHTWAETVEAGATPTSHWASHVLELQQEIQRIADYVNAWDSTTTARGVSLPTFEVPTSPKVSVLQQLRNCITLL